jgi:hypothetical protein
MNEESKPDESKFWFPAKKYGWGWGLPNCWQGWMMLIAYVLLVAAGFPLMPANAGLYIARVRVLSIILTAVCRLEGEKPGWRRGGKQFSRRINAQNFPPSPRLCAWPWIC